MQAVKGTHGYWHATEGDYHPRYDGLKTLCGRGISPNYQRFNEQDVRRVVDCPKCLQKLMLVRKAPSTHVRKVRPAITI